MSFSIQKDEKQANIALRSRHGPIFLSAEKEWLQRTFFSAQVIKSIQSGVTKASSVQSGSYSLKEKLAMRRAALISQDIVAEKKRPADADGLVVGLGSPAPSTGTQLTTPVSVRSQAGLPSASNSSKRRKRLPFTPPARLNTDAVAAAAAAASPVVVTGPASVKSPTASPAAAAAAVVDAPLPVAVSAAPPITPALQSSARRTLDRTPQELRQLTVKWRGVCQAVLSDLLSRAVQRSRESDSTAPLPTMSQLLDAVGLEPALVRYNAETEEFEDT